jgi:peptidoglycan/LPS O-acetylase OafA/YrhL
LIGDSLIEGRYRNSKLIFLRNRGLRIIPLTYAALILGLLIQIMTSGSLNFEIFRQFLFLPADFNMTLVGPLWTIAVEIQFYLFCAVALELFKNFCFEKYLKASVFFCIIACLFFAGDIMVAIDDNHHQPRSLLGNSFFFFLGLAVSMNGTIKTKHSTAIKMSVLGLGVFFACYLENHRTLEFWSFKDSLILGDAGLSGIYPPFGAGAFIAMSISVTAILMQPPSTSAVWLQFTKPIRSIGKLCFGVYVFHSILLVSTYNMFGIERGWVIFGITLLSLPLAAISYKYFEAPLLKFKM